MRNGSCVNQQGFTLIETVLAISITAVLLLTLLTALKLGISSWEKGEAVLERAALKRSISYRLEKETLAMYPYVLKEKDRRTAFLGTNSGFGFVTSASTASGMPAPMWVYYTYGDKGLVVHEKYITAENLLSLAGGELVEAETEIKNASFEYLGKDGWSGEWEPRKEEFPIALKAEFLLKNEEKFQITLPLGLGANSQSATPQR